MKKIILLVTTLLLWMPAEGNAQKWLKDLGNAVKSVDKVLGVSSSSTSSSSSSLSSAVGTTQQGGIKITTHHPDLKIKITRCEVSGRTCVINMLVTNVSGQDVKAAFHGGSYISVSLSSVAIDDEGNRYGGGKRDLLISDMRDTTTGQVGVLLASNVPIKMGMRIEGVAESITQFSRINLVCECSEFGLNSDKLITFSNIPISREGDE